MSNHPQILQLDIAGNPQRWIDFEDAAYYYAKDMVAWSISGGEFTIYGGVNGASGDTSTLDIETIIAVKSEHGNKSAKYAHRTPTLSNRALFRRDHHLCAYCGNIFSPSDLTRDHVIPKSRNGVDRWENVVTACGSCNKFKDARTPAEANMELLYVPYAPSQSEYLILMNRNILANQMEFLLANVPSTSRLIDKKFQKMLQP